MVSMNILIFSASTGGGHKRAAAALQDSFSRRNPDIHVEVVDGLRAIGEFYNKWKAIEEMENGKVCIFSAGTGQPYFTTDTGSSLRGVEIEADVMLKGTRVDGIYTADPEKDPTATKFDDITYEEILERNLKVMDLSAVVMCNDNHMPIYVFNMDVVGNLKKVLDGEPIGTYVHS
jgi:uridylate kinase